MKRIVEHPYGKKVRGGGHVYLIENLLKSVKKAEAVEVGKITVGTRNLAKLLNLIPTQDVLVRSNGGLELEAVIRHYEKAKDGKPAIIRFRKPKRETFMHLVDRAWLNGEPQTVVVIRPKTY